MTTIRAMLTLTGELKGIDRTRPIGIMAFIEPGEAPEPVAIGYLPITSIDLLRKTLKQISTIRLSTATDAQGLYTLTSPGETFAVKVQNRYVFVARKPISLKRPLGDPAKRNSELTTGLRSRDAGESVRGSARHENDDPRLSACSGRR